MIHLVLVCIDLYQVHWPDRYATTFSRISYEIENERESIPIEETVGAMKQLIESGKIKYYGLSNETTFGVCEWCKAADKVSNASLVSHGMGNNIS